MYGYIDKTGKYIINPQFWGAEGFSEGRARIAIKGGKYGYIDKAGKLIAEPQFDDAQIRYSDGVALVKFSGIVDGKWIDRKFGYIDTTGKYIIDPQFDYAQPFFEGFAAVEIGDSISFINKSGKNVWISPKVINK